MIIRTVKMTFDPEKVGDFIKIFEFAHHKIEAFPGCKGVDLYRDLAQQNVLITISLWESLQHLDAYRKSELFKSTWEETKKLFIDRADAWSLEKIM